MFIVSEVHLESGAEGSEVSVKVDRAGGVKCERCWKYTRDVGANPRFETLCAPCVEAVTIVLGS